MTLEDIVPSLELCKQIPNESFEDSALVWAVNGSSCFIEQRELMEYANRSKTLAPAPTLVEILPELYALAGADVVETYFDSSGWSVRYVYTMSDDDDVDDDMLDDNYNPAYAALKLWLNLTKGGKDGK